jgi:hypothetical protein
LKQIADLDKKEKKHGSKRRRMKLSKTTCLFLFPPQLKNTLNKTKGIYFSVGVGYRGSLSLLEAGGSSWRRTARRSRDDPRKERESCVNARFRERE